MCKLLATLFIQVKSLEDSLKAQLSRLADHCKAAVTIIGSYRTASDILALALRVGSEADIARMAHITSHNEMHDLVVPGVPKQFSVETFKEALNRVLLTGKADDNAINECVTT